jgi:hypothetical protein
MVTALALLKVAGFYGTLRARMIETAALRKKRLPVIFLVQLGISWRRVIPARLFQIRKLNKIKMLYVFVEVPFRTIVSG